jgi:hypothetical protein
MLLIILNFIRRHWLVVAEAILLLTIGIQHVEISYLGDKVAEYKLQNTALQDSNIRFAAAVENQNSAVAKLQAESQRKNTEAAKSLVVARDNARKYAARAGVFKTWQMSGNECADMSRMLDDYVRHGG